MKWLGVFLLIVTTGCTSAISIASGTSGSSVNGSSGGGSSGAASGTGSAAGSSAGSAVTGGATTGGECGTLSACPLPDGGSICANEALDPANCGGCGHTCIPGDGCNGASCTCDAGHICDDDAGEVCTSLRDDSLNCGECGFVCPALETCAPNAVCACTLGTVCAIDGGGEICIDVNQDDDNCGQCGFACGLDYGIGSFCDAGQCTCDAPIGTPGPCASVSNGSLSCSCLAGDPCNPLSFARDVYPFLAQQSGTFGCSASGCHSGQYPQADLAFIDDGGQMDAGMAYAELLGTGKGGGGFDIPFCDAGTPPFSPSTQCACFSRVIPGQTNASLITDLVTNDIPAACADSLQPMPKDPATGAWVPLPPCSQQLIVQWVETGAKP